MEDDNIKEVESLETIEEITEGNGLIKVLQVRINESVKRKNKQNENKEDTYPSSVLVYRCTKGGWIVNFNKIKEIDLVVAQYNGQLIEVFRVDKKEGWREVGRTEKYIRYGFEGDLLKKEEQDLREKILKNCKVNKSLNPVRYVNISQ